MIRNRLKVSVAAALVAAASVGAPRPAGLGANQRRLDLLDEAFAAVDSDPRRAAQLFADAGPGATLERVRLEEWLAALEVSDAGEEAWRPAGQPHPAGFLFPRE